MRGRASDCSKDSQLPGGIRHGEFIEFQYSEEEYRTLYNDILDNLHYFNLSKNRAQQLEGIQRGMFRAGV